MKYFLIHQICFLVLGFRGSESPKIGQVNNFYDQQVRCGSQTATADDECFSLQIENLLDQLRDKEKQLSGLKDRVKSLQTDTSNTDTALGTLEEALAEKVHTH